MERQKTNYGIVLSGGGARGLAHIGVLAALEHYGISPQFISGNSMGAVIGAFYASGLHPDEMLSIAKKEKLYKLFKWSLPKGGMLHLDILKEMLQANIPYDSFEALPKKLFIAVSNISKGEGEIISSGPLFQAVLASASIPVVFQPQMIDGHTFVDGGLFNDLPVDPLVGVCDRIIASHVNYNGPEPELKSIKAIAERVYRLAIYQHVRKNMQMCDYVIDPPELREHGIFDFKHIDKLFEIGYNAAEKVIFSMVDHLNIDRIMEKKNKNPNN